MTHKQIRLGGSYWMMVSGQLVPVTVEAIRERYNTNDQLVGYTYRCTNQRTGRTCKAHSPAKFREEYTK